MTDSLISSFRDHEDDAQPADAWERQDATRHPRIIGINNVVGKWDRMQQSYGDPPNNFGPLNLHASYCKATFSWWLPVATTSASSR